MFHSILCATDLSPRSEQALRAAVQLAAHFGAELTVLNVHEEFMDKQEMVMLRVSVDHMQEHFREIALKAREEMRERVSAIGVEDLKVHYLLHEGKAAETILKTAAEIAAGQQGQGVVLTVMGSNGRDSLLDMLLGSVAEHVVRNATMPVLVIPHVTP